MPISKDPSDYTDDARGESLAGISQRGLGGVVLAMATVLIGIQQGIANAFLRPLDSLGRGSGDIISAFTSEPANAFGDVITFTAYSLTRGDWAFFGPFSPLVFAGVLLGMLWMLTRYLDQRNSDLPGLGADLPFIGNESDGKED